MENQNLILEREPEKHLVHVTEAPLYLGTVCFWIHVTVVKVTLGVPIREYFCQCSAISSKNP